MNPKQANLFKTKLVPSKEGSGRLFDEELVASDSPVVCLGMTFESDEARRAYFTEELRKKLQDPEFRKIEGFPIGEDEDILNLSDPPYYTACPNPWLGDFIRFWEEEKSRDKGEGARGESEPYHREPFAADVSEGKNHPIYNAHSYHTKVPHRAVMRYILHYTEPGDIVFDGFCGTGMTGVAAQMCGDRKEVMALGYQVQEDGTILQEEVDESGKKVWRPFSKLGARKAILNDLSPAATFIAYNYNTPVDINAFEKEAKRILDEVEQECGWMYETYHVEQASSLSIEQLYDTAVKRGYTPPKFSDIQRAERDLPHWHYKGAILFVTFRTYGDVQLNESARKTVLDAIKHFHGTRINLYSAVVMPDHAHMLFQLLDDDLSKLMHSIKSFSANQVNQIMERSGILWQNESYDRIVRDSKEFFHVSNYIWRNPERAKLVADSNDYEWLWVSEEMKNAGWKPAPLGKINYTVWSDVFVCPECTKEVVFWEAAVDKEAGKVQDKFPCPHCQALLTKRRMERAWVTFYDKAINETVRQAKQIPVLINYTVELASSQLSISRLEAGSTISTRSTRSTRFEKKPDQFDLDLIKKIDEMEIPYWFPFKAMPLGFNTHQPKVSHGYTHVHHFYKKRNLCVLAALLSKSSLSAQKYLCRFLFQQWVIGMSCLNRYSPTHFSQNNRNLSGTLYIGSQISEVSISYAFHNKLKRLKGTFGFERLCPGIITQQDAAALFQIDDAQIDYIFLDPPFGANLNYSELNFLWESWSRVWTNNKPEAIENKTQGKGLGEYRQLMLDCFKEAYRILKPGRWMTVEFSNTKASVWNTIQKALEDAGFIIANVSALDKQQGSFKAVTTPTAVKQDLVISAYKPNGGFEERFEKLVSSRQDASMGSRQDAGSTAVWEFVRTHLRYLPVVKMAKGLGVRGESENSSLASHPSPLLFIPERDPRILFDQMVAYYVRKDLAVPLSSPEFQMGLMQRFPERDGMFFLPEQVIEYDKKRLQTGQAPQRELFVFDERSAIDWLTDYLKVYPSTYQDIHPVFIKQLGTSWKKHEARPELTTLLNQNFLCYDGVGDVPSQIHSYLSSNWPEMRRLEAKAKDRWYVPDPNKAGDLEKLRERVLLREFDNYVAQASSLRRLTVFRLEAVRAGFKRAWQERNYDVIIQVADKIPASVLEEDAKLLMWYDQAVTRLGQGARD